MQEPFDTPEKVLDEKIDIGMYNYQGSTTIAFSGTRNPLYKEIWESMSQGAREAPLSSKFKKVFFYPEKEWITSFGDTLEKVVTGDTVFMDYRFSLEAMMIGGFMDARGRPKIYLANYNTFRHDIDSFCESPSLYQCRWNFFPPLYFAIFDFLDRSRSVSAKSRWRVTSPTGALSGYH